MDPTNNVFATFNNCISVVGSEHEASLMAHAEPTMHRKKMTRAIEIECMSVLLSTSTKMILVEPPG